MVHLHRSANGEFYTTIVATNGKTLYHSETVKRRGSAFKTIAAAAKDFGAKWKGRYMDNTGDRPEVKIHAV